MDDLSHSDPLPEESEKASTALDKSIRLGLARDGTRNLPLPGGERERSPEFLFCDNETNVRRLYGQAEARGYFKDAFHEYLIAGNKAAVNPQQTGTKAHTFRDARAEKGSVTIRLRLSRAILAKPFADCDKLHLAPPRGRRVHPTPSDLPTRRAPVQRQAFAGMIWSKQFFHYDAGLIKGDANQPRSRRTQWGRNREWRI
jgi:hypothetical protein